MVGLLFAGLITVIDAGPGAADGVPVELGHVLVAVGNGKIRHFDGAGRLLDTLDTGARGESGGLFVDGAGGLHAANFAANSVTRFDRSGNKMGPFGQQYDTHPETILRTADNSIYIGLNDGTRQLRRFDTLGTVRQAFQPAVERRGVDWADLSSDQCTLLYTSEGRLVKRFNVCRDEQLPDLAVLPITGDNTTNPTSSAYGLRILPSGEVLVATAATVFRLTREGVVLRRYDIPRTSQLLTVNLDPDLATFWVGDLPTGRVSRVDLQSGRVVATLETDPAVGLGGVAVVGEVVAAVPLLRLDPPPPGNVGQPVTLTGTLLNVVNPETAEVVFNVTGANRGADRATVDASGRVAFTYVGPNIGTDTVTVTAKAATPPVTLTGVVPVTWSAPRPGTLVYSGATAGASGATAYLAARLTDPANLPVAGLPVDFALAGGRSCRGVTDASGVASCPILVDGAPRMTTVTASFPGDPRLAAVTATSPFEVVLAQGPQLTPTAVVLLGPPAAIQGEGAQLRARVVDTTTNQPLGGMFVTFALNGTETCTATTDADGVATCAVATNQPPGRYPVTAAVTGPGLRRPSSTTGLLVVRGLTGPIAGGRAVALRSDGPILAGLNLADTGRVTSEGDSSTERILLGFPGPPLRLGVASSSVETFPGGATATTAVADLDLVLGGILPRITIRGVEAESESTCTEGSSGTARVVDISLAGITLFGSDLTVAPNTGINVPAIGPLPRISLVVNEQVVVNDARGSRVVVSAVHLVIPGIVDIAVAQASTDVRNCPAAPPGGGA